MMMMTLLPPDGATPSTVTTTTTTPYPQTGSAVAVASSDDVNVALADGGLLHRPDLTVNDLIQQPVCQLHLQAKTPSLSRNTSFVLLWLAQVVSQLADRVIFVVFLAIIATQYSTDARYVSFLYVAFTIPAILLTA
jgi:hypothetical protein